MLNLALIGVDTNTEKVLTALREDGRYFVNAAYADTFECNLQFSLNHDIDAVYMQVNPLLKRTDIDVVYVSATIAHPQSVIRRALSTGKTVLIADTLATTLQHGNLIRLSVQDGEALGEEIALVGNAMSTSFPDTFEAALAC